MDDSTPGLQQTMQALLTGGSPGPGTSGSRVLPTPAVLGLLRQLRISTPALGPQVCSLFDHDADCHSADERQLCGRLHALPEVLL